MDTWTRADETEASMTSKAPEPLDSFKAVRSRGGKLMWTVLVALVLLWAREELLKLLMFGGIGAVLVLGVVTYLSVVDSRKMRARSREAEQYFTERERLAKEREKRRQESESKRRTKRPVSGSGVLTAQILMEDYDLPEDVSGEVGRLADVIVHEFINSWYKPISRSDDFRSDVRILLAQIMGTLCAQVRDRFSVLTFVLKKATKVIEAHLHWYAYVRSSLAEHRPTLFKDTAFGDERKMLDLDILKTRHYLIVGEMRELRLLHPALCLPDDIHADVDRAAERPDDRNGRHLRIGQEHPEYAADQERMTPREEEYLQDVGEGLLSHLLPEEDARCRAVFHLARDLLAMCVLRPLTHLVSPGNLNKWILLGIDVFCRRQAETNTESSRSSQHYDYDKARSNNIDTAATVGLAPPGFKPEGCWKSLIGSIGTEEAGLLLQGESKGTYLLRKSQADHIYILSYVAGFQVRGSASAVAGGTSGVESEPILVDNTKEHCLPGVISMPDSLDNLQRLGFIDEQRVEEYKTSAAHTVAAIRETLSLSRNQIEEKSPRVEIFDDQETIVRHVRLRLEPRHFQYIERDDFFIDHLFVLSDGFKSLTELLEHLDFIDDGLHFKPYSDAVKSECDAALAAAPSAEPNAEESNQDRRKENGSRKSTVDPGPTSYERLHGTADDSKQKGFAEISSGDHTTTHGDDRHPEVLRPDAPGDPRQADENLEDPPKDDDSEAVHRADPTNFAEEAAIADGIEAYMERLGDVDDFGHLRHQVIDRPLISKTRRASKRLSSSSFTSIEAHGGAVRSVSGDEKDEEDASLTFEDDNEPIRQSVSWFAPWWREKRVASPIHEIQRGASKDPSQGTMSGNLHTAATEESFSEDAFIVVQERRCLIIELQAAVMRIQDLTEAISDAAEDGVRRLKLLSGGDRALYHLVDAVYHILMHGYHVDNPTRSLLDDSSLSNSPSLQNGARCSPTVIENKESDTAMPDGFQSPAQDETSREIDEVQAQAPLKDGCRSRDEVLIDTQYFAESTAGPPFLETFQRLIRGDTAEERVKMAEIYSVVDAQMLSNREIEVLRESIARIEHHEEPHGSLVETGSSASYEENDALRERCWISVAILEGRLYDILATAVNERDKLENNYDTSAILRVREDGLKLLSLLRPLENVKVIGDLSYLITGSHVPRNLSADPGDSGMFLKNLNPMTVGSSLVKSSLYYASYLAGASNFSTAQGQQGEDDDSERDSDHGSLLYSTISRASSLVAPMRRRSSEDLPIPQGTSKSWGFEILTSHSGDPGVARTRSSSSAGLSSVTDLYSHQERLKQAQLFPRRKLFARVSNYRIRTLKRSGGLGIAPRKLVVYEIAVGTVSESGELPFLPSIRSRLRAGAWGLGHATDVKVPSVETNGFSMDAEEDDADDAMGEEHEDEDEEDGVYADEDDTLLYTPQGGTSSGQELARHVGGVQNGAAFWRIERRYNDFKRLHAQIRDRVRAEVVGTLPSLPEKKIIFNLDERFILKRGRALDRYLVGLLRHPVVAAMPEVGMFLSPSRAVPVHAAAIQNGAKSTRGVVHIGKVVTDDFLVDDDTADEVSEAIAGHPVARGVHQPGPKQARPSDIPRRLSESDLQQPTSLLNASMSDDSSQGVSSQGIARPWPKFRFNPFELKACEAAVFGLATELFQLNRSGLARRSTIHLVRRAASVLFSSSMISALETQYQSLSTSTTMTGFVRWLREKTFPDGRFMGSRDSPSEDERAHVRNRLCAGIPGVLPSAITTLVGYNTALTGAMHFYEFIQCPVLLRSVVYTLMDLVWCELFPDMSKVVHGMMWIAKR